MAAGDLCTGPGMIEVYRSDTDRIVMGKGTKYWWREMIGADAPAMRTNDLTKPLGHGSIAGVDRFEPRQIGGVMLIEGSSQSDLSRKKNDLAKVMRPVRIGESDAILTWWHWGSMAPQRLTGRPRRLEYNVGKAAILAHLNNVGWMFEAQDPRFYSSTEQSRTATIEAGQSTVSSTIINTGNMESEPILELTGPWTNPRITSTQDANRQIRIDITLSASQTLIVDIKNRTATLAGVNQAAAIRADNQWWELLPGSNLISASRTGTTGAAVFKVRWRNAWSTAGDPALDLTSIPGLALELDASKISGYTQAAALAQWNDTSGNNRHATQTTAANRPWVSDRDRWLQLPGTSGAYASAPDTVALSITGDFCYLAKVALDDWTPAAINQIVSKWSGDGNLLRVLSGADAGKLQLFWTPLVGGALSRTSTVAVSATDGSIKWVAASLDVDNGAVGHDVKFWTSDDGATWTQLGTTVTTAGVTTVKDTAHQVIIGGRSDVTTENLDGKVYYAEIRSGAGPTLGSIVANPNFARLSGTTVTDDFSNTFTMQGTASIGTGAVRAAEVEFKQNDSLNLPNFLTGATEATAFVVLKAAADPSSTARGIWEIASANNDTWPNVASVSITFSGTDPMTVDPAANLASQYRVLSVHAIAGDKKLFLDGDQIASSTSSVITWSVTPRLGAAFGGGLPWDGKMKLLLLYNRKLTDLERVSIEGYLLRTYV